MRKFFPSDNIRKKIQRVGSLDLQAFVFDKLVGTPVYVADETSAVSETIVFYQKVICGYKNLFTI